MATQNLPAVSTEQKEIIYTAADGNEIKLTPDMVRKYLVQGHGEMVTTQEMVFFLNVCKSRKLNPLIRDCYLIKYSASDPAAIVTSVDFFRKRARAQKDCKGWKSGIIVEDREGKVRDTAGLFRDGEKLLGGWFEAKPDGWTDPLRLEVNLRGYVKKKSDGSVTRFWSPDNQPSQIMKVAESQGLRKLWPDEFQGIYSEEEITQQDRNGAVDVITEDKPDLSASVAEFDKATTDKGLMEKYVTVAAKHFKKSPEEIKAEAMKDLPGFLTAYEKWAALYMQKEALKKKAAEPKKNVDALTGMELAPGPCPNREDKEIMTVQFCGECKQKEGCPVWG
jgi:phage recombination protein Bet